MKQGSFGDYLRYNSPHKSSLYLAAGLPVIVWSGPVLASFVREQGVGVVVGSLFEAQKTLAAIGLNEYAGLLENVVRVRTDIVAGERLGRLIP